MIDPQEVIDMLRGFGKPYDQGGWGGQHFNDAARCVESLRASILTLEECQTIESWAKAARVKFRESHEQEPANFKQLHDAVANKINLQAGLNSEDIVEP